MTMTGAEKATYDELMRKAEAAATSIAEARQMMHRRSTARTALTMISLFATWLMLTVVTVNTIGSSFVVTMLMAGWMCFGATVALAATHRI